MTVTRTDMATITQGDEISSPNGAASLKEEGARSGTESEFVQAIPVLSNTAVNVASVPQRSPLRYPGGKTWLVPEIRKYLAGLDFRPEVFVEPFAGGGIASLTAVMDCYVDRAVLCERDPDISNLWQCMLDDAEELARRVEGFVATPENVNAMFRGCRGVRHGRRLSNPVAEQGQSGWHHGQGRFGDEGGRERAWDFLTLVP